jgi:hypothetical protein
MLYFVPLWDGSLPLWIQINGISFLRSDGPRPKDKGLQKVYVHEEEEDLRSDFHALIALAFLPLQDVEPVFEAISEIVDQRLLPVIEHLYDNCEIRRISARDPHSTALVCSCPDACPRREGYSRPAVSGCL